MMKAIKVIISKRALCLALLVLATLLPAAPAFSRASVDTERVTVTLGSVQFYPCAGEFIALSGDYHNVFHVTFDPSGGTHVENQWNTTGISAVGLTSGVQYRAVDNLRGSTNIFGAPGFETTFIRTFRLIGRRDAPTIVVRVITHVTFSPVIGFTAEVENVISECESG